MTASATQNSFRQPSATDCYDPDDVLPRDSPQMQPHRPKLLPSPSPPPTFSSDRKPPHGRRKVEPIQGDAVLVAHLGNGRQPEIAHAAALEPLASDNGSEDDSSSPESPGRDMNRPPPPDSFDLKSLAAGALAAFTTPTPATAAVAAAVTAKHEPLHSKDGTGGQHETTLVGISSLELPIRDERPGLAAPAIVYSIGDKLPSQHAGPSLHKPDVTSPTQYLLNSHANVHSSARPHYCSVKGCPRSEGGKGFKRKNEMIRHGLVHDSPGYTICKDMSESITWTKTKMTRCYGRSFPSGQMGPTAADGAEEGLLNILGQSLIHTSHEIRLWAHDRIGCQ
ncbi:hypothetical protein CFRS1_v010207 [Colletotrichum fructicola]|nr:hypothetical protein CFRS1_v010207 [Colletotrichum fructicola]